MLAAALSVGLSACENASLPNTGTEAQAGAAGQEAANTPTALNVSDTPMQANAGTQEGPASASAANAEGQTEFAQRQADGDPGEGDGGQTQENGEPQAEPQAEPQPEQQVEPQSKPQAEPQAEPQTEPQPEQQSEPSMSEAAQLAVASYARQIVIVRAHGDTTCDISLHELIDGAWQCTHSSSGVVGMAGVGHAYEGSLRTPEGAFGLGFAFGNAPNPGTSMEYRQTTWSTVWVDDPSSAYYNQWVDASEVTPDWNSAEQLASIASYSYCVFIQYNTDPVVPGAGSAFFFHPYSNVGSYGCVQTSEYDMVEYLQRLRDGAVIVIANEDDIYNY